MKKCQFCAEDIQDAAILCKHCGRELPAAVAPAATAVPPKRKTSALTWLVVGIFALMLIGALAPKQTSTRPPTTASSSKAMAVKVAWNSTALQVTNTDAEAAGKPMTVYINGTPPFTYKTTSVVPAVGESVQLPLIEFTMKNGDRFNPMAKAVTVAWVGGSGYDYASFGK